MQASEIMTSPVKTIGPDATIEEAIEMLLSLHVSGLPVADADGRLLGVISEGDFLHRAELGTSKRKPRWIEFLLGPGETAESYVMSHGRKVREVMTHDVVTVGSTASVNEVVALLDRRGVKRLPVMTGDQIVGIITRSDLLRALARNLGSKPVSPAETTDQAILDKLLAELQQQGFASPKSLDVTVERGVVTLSGEIFDERQRPALIVAAENIPGVTRVVDKLMWIEPFSGMAINKAEGI
ncbi:CBS domain-containing protein [Rhodoblastus acidophilus]|uniref:CBS domain-containing protein n=1 Tax=Candidatus Rhodoblastus alkanivorans TaxID=2954117 RepID=A0ABS9ZBH6_9HYPH|nr:CBS domain-containing protein [Candidatus Rhodoblastus alkanivorans]MCI4680870.1 CBS domain-containing protein [Candidatus Rhodoblastus alkanivorans]MCI4683992.1 CBS domain-containing protein [Candidatus Rhodoblastus alkanivorans]MDI4641311.1 CBS domain-containing protein [Rhodoblastus acidophilus]